MEETVQVLFDEGALVRNGAVKLTQPLNESRFRRQCRRFWPRASIGLRADHKELLQTLAVIGKEFALRSGARAWPASAR